MAKIIDFKTGKILADLPYKCSKIEVQAWRLDYTHALTDKVYIIANKAKQAEIIEKRISCEAIEKAS